MSSKMPLYKYFMLFKLEVGGEFRFNDIGYQLSETLEDIDVYNWDNLIKRGYMYRRHDADGETYIGLTDKAMALIRRKAKQDE